LTPHARRVYYCRGRQFLFSITPRTLEKESSNRKYELSGVLRRSPPSSLASSEKTAAPPQPARGFRETGHARSVRCSPSRNSHRRVRPDPGVAFWYPARTSIEHSFLRFVCCPHGLRAIAWVGHRPPGVSAGCCCLCARWNVLVPNPALRIPLCALPSGNY